MTASGAISLLWLPRAFVAALLGYVAMTFAYSLWLKRKLLVDVFMLALLYTVRILAGSAAVSVEISGWLAGFSVFLFISLAFAKRDSELRRMANEGGYRAHGRGYSVSDMPVIQNIGGTCGCLAALVLAMYINSDQVRQLYARPQMLWVLCLALLYWITRIWFFAARAELPEDPIVFALHDRVSRVVALVCIGAIVFACV